ncbi:MAG: hypothetical protein ACRCVN_00700 [Spirochaetia bacterium]
MSKSVYVVGILTENGLCPTKNDLQLPNVIRGLVYIQDNQQIYTMLGEKEMQLAMENYYLLEDGRDIAVYTSKKDMHAKILPNTPPDVVYTARIFGPEEQKNPLLDLPFYCISCANGTLQLCQKIAKS